LSTWDPPPPGDGWFTTMINPGDQLVLGFHHQSSTKWGYRLGLNYKF
jgi:hypothetical protein